MAAAARRSGRGPGGGAAMDSHCESPMAGSVLGERRETQKRSEVREWEEKDCGWGPGWRAPRKVLASGQLLCCKGSAILIEAKKGGLDFGLWRSVGCSLVHQTEEVRPHPAGYLWDTAVAGLIHALSLPAWAVCQHTRFTANRNSGVQDVGWARGGRSTG